MTTQALAVVGNQQLTQTQNAVAPTLDRENLTFLATMIEQADLIPKEQGISPQVQKYRVMAKIVGGTAYGFDAISAQENLHIINGKLTLSARGMSVLLQRSGKYTTRIEKLDANGCKLAVLERNNQGEWILKGHVEFSRQHAEKAGLTKNPNYSKYAEDMFFARCVSRVVKRFAPDVLNGQAPTYNLAKQPQLEVVEPPSNVAQLPTQTVGENYRDEVVEAETDVEADFIEAEPEKSEREENITILENLLNEVTKGDAAERKKILKGKTLEQMPDDEIIALIDSLSAQLS